MSPESEIKRVRNRRHAKTENMEGEKATEKDGRICCISLKLRLH